MGEGGGVHLESSQPENRINGGTRVNETPRARSRRVISLLLIRADSPVRASPRIRTRIKLISVQLRKYPQHASAPRANPLLPDARA